MTLTIQHKPLWTIVLVLATIHGMTAQDQLPIENNEPVAAEETDSITYINMKAIEAYHSSVTEISYDTLLGEVEMIQDSLIMYCDRAYLQDQIYANAYDNVVIIHEDSLWIFADSLYYDGKNKMAELYGEVILQEANRRLYTHQLTYDISNKIAFYNTGGTLIEGNSTIVSKSGYYYSEREESKLMGNVVFRDSTQTMNTDSVLYFSHSQRLKFIAPTNITQDSTQIYCESGIYSLEDNKGVLSKNVQVLTGDSTEITSGILQIDQNIGEYTFLINPKIIQQEDIAWSDTLVFLSETDDVQLQGNANYESPTESIQAPRIDYNITSKKYKTIGRASIAKPEQSIDANKIETDSLDNTILSGAVRLEDYEEGIIVESETVIQYDSLTKVFTPGSQPLMTYLLGEDSLLMRADTFEMKEYYQGTDSITQEYKAVNDVTLYKSNVYGRAKHLIYNKEDSLITLTGRAILWSDSTQLTGDTIQIFLSNDEIKYIDLIGNAFILSPDIKDNLNQIKGLRIRNNMIDGQLHTTRVTKNAELLYLVLQEDTYEAINVAKSSKMLLLFEEGEIERIRMDGDQESNLHEYKPGMDIPQFYLTGYEWRIEELPLSSDFVYSYVTQKIPIQSK